MQRRLAEDVAFRVLAAGNEPDFRTIADFRKRICPCCRASLSRCWGSRGNWGRRARRARGRGWQQGESERLEAQGDELRPDGAKTRQLRDEVRQFLAQAEATDTAEDTTYGADQRGDELPAELQRRESRFAADYPGSNPRRCQGYSCWSDCASNPARQRPPYWPARKSAKMINATSSSFEENGLAKANITQTEQLCRRKSTFTRFQVSADT